MVNNFLTCFGHLIRGALFGYIIGNILIHVIFNSPFFYDNKTTPELNPYIQKFIERCHQYNVNCSKIKAHTMKISSMPWRVRLISKYAIGVCSREHNQVVIDKDYWEYSSKIEREALVFHELGHCVLDKEHTEGEFIMNPEMLTEIIYKLTYQKIYDHFFGCSKNCPVISFNGERYR